MKTRVCLKYFVNDCGIDRSVVCELGILRYFGPKKLHKKNQQNSQKFRTIPSLYAQFSMPKCPDIRIIHTAYKKNGHVVV